MPRLGLEGVTCWTKDADLDSGTLPGTGVPSHPAVPCGILGSHPSGVRSRQAGQQALREVSTARTRPFAILPQPGTVV